MSIREREVFAAEFEALAGVEIGLRTDMAMRAVGLHRAAIRKPWDDLPEDKAKVFRAVCAEARRLYGMDSGQLTSKCHEAAQARRWIRTAMSVVFGTMETARIFGTGKGMISDTKKRLRIETPEEFSSANAFGEQLKEGLEASRARARPGVDEAKQAAGKEGAL